MEKDQQGPALPLITRYTSEQKIFATTALRHKSIEEWGGVSYPSHHIIRLPDTVLFNYMDNVPAPFSEAMKDLESVTLPRQSFGTNHEHRLESILAYCIYHKNEKGKPRNGYAPLKKLCHINCNTLIFTFQYN